MLAPSEHGDCQKSHTRECEECMGLLLSRALRLEPDVEEHDGNEQSFFHSQY